VRLTFVGHACFLVETDAGVRVLLDPYQPGAFGGRMGLGPFLERVDVVASTHGHLDHFHMDPAFGRPAVVRGTATAAGIGFRGVALPHDDQGGAARGMCTGLAFEGDGVAVFHPGDLGRPPTPAEVAAIGRVDVLLLPVGGTFTIGPEGALATIAALRPAIAVPMHYAHPAVALPLLPVDDFLKLAGAHERVAAQPLVIHRATLPTPTRIMVLDPTH
jgi:L-ascorbate metabolism protein UlaG (beta-lactamase superfamily)